MHRFACALLLIGCGTHGNEFDASTTTDAGGLSYSENFSIAVDNVNETPTDIALSSSNVAENAAGAVIGAAGHNSARTVLAAMGLGSRA